MKTITEETKCRHHKGICLDAVIFTELAMLVQLIRRQGVNRKIKSFEIPEKAKHI